MPRGKVWNPENFHLTLVAGACPPFAKVPHACKVANVDFYCIPFLNFSCENLIRMTEIKKRKADEAPESPTPMKMEKVSSLSHLTI